MKAACNSTRLWTLVLTATFLNAGSAPTSASDAPTGSTADEDVTVEVDSAESQPGPKKPSKEPQANPKELNELLNAAPDAAVRRRLGALARTEAAQRILFRSYLDAFLSLDKKGVLDLNDRVGRNQPGAEIEYQCWGVMFVDSERRAIVGIEKVWHHKDGPGGMRGAGSSEKAGELYTRLQRIQDLLGKVGVKGLRDKRLPRVQFSFVPPHSERFPESNVPVHASAEGVAYVCLAAPADEGSSSDSSP